MNIQFNSIDHGLKPQPEAAAVHVKSTAVDIPTSSQPAKAKPAVDPAVLQAATEKINQALQDQGSALEFRVDSETSKNIVRVVDKETNKTIRQFPSEETLAIAKTLDKLKGLLIRVKA